MSNPDLDRAIQLFQEDRLDDAAEILNTLIENDGASIDAYEGLARISARSGRIEEAAEYANRAAHFPEANFEVHQLAGMANRLVGDHEKALASYERCLQLVPGHLQSIGELAILQSILGNHEVAHKEIATAIRRHPSIAELYYIRGQVFGNEGRFDEEINEYKLAIKLNPRMIDAYINAGVAYRELHKFDDALSMFKKALAIDPNNAPARNNRAQTNLMLQNFEHGWREYEWRWRDGVQSNPYHAPLWMGQPAPAGKTLLIHAEQGFGDTLQFIRYLHPLSEVATDLVVVVQPQLRSLLADQFPGIPFVTGVEDLQPYDLQTPLMSLPLALIKTCPGIPVHIPYVVAPTEKVELWRRRTESLSDGKRLKVGLSWAGSRKFFNDRRVVNLSELSPIFGIDCDFVSLQKDLTQTDRDHLTRAPELHDFTGELHDFSDTAGLIASLDIVITIDTAVAHLAGAMGKEVWTMLGAQADWRWHIDRDDSPWYPTMTLFRQNVPGSWSSVIAKVIERLEQRVSEFQPLEN